MSDMQLSPSVAQVFITDELSRRPPSVPNYTRQKLGIQELAGKMADRPDELLPHLVELALDICDADSAGVSVLEGPVFRWLGLKGKLATFEGANTPRDFSPCGICLDRHAPILMAHPERVYDWIAEARITVPEVLLVPLFVNDEAPLGTLWVVARDGQKFDSGHVRVMTELAGFTGMAVRTIQAEAKLKPTL